MIRVLLVLLAAFSLNAQRRLSPEEDRGRQIYEHGTSPSGTSIVASLSGSDEVNGSIVPCVNCHGPTGEGKPEAGVVPSNITWEALTRPYAVTNPDGRSHPPYTDRLFRRAVTTGIDPAGNPLNGAMPRFQLSSADAADLVAYVKKLGQQLDPGLTQNKVRLGVVLSPASQNSVRRVFSQAVLDYFSRLNEAGGMYGRQLELAFMDLPPNRTERAHSLRKFLHDEEPFAVIGDFTGAEAELSAVIRETRTPALAAFAPFPQTESPPNPYVFYLDGGLQEELDALARFALQQAPGNNVRTTIVSSGDELVRTAAKRIQADLAEADRRKVLLSEGAAPEPADLIFWLRSDVRELPALIGSNGNAVILVPGSLFDAPQNTITNTNSQLFLALRLTLPIATGGDSSPLTRLMWDRANASAAILAEAMKAAGRDLSHTTLISALEDLQDVQSNLTATITFSPIRHVGSSGVRIMALDRPSRKWVLVSQP